MEMEGISGLVGGGGCVEGMMAVEVEVNALLGVSGMNGGLGGGSGNGGGGGGGSGGVGVELSSGGAAASPPRPDNRIRRGGSGWQRRGSINR